MTYGSQVDTKFSYTAGNATVVTLEPNEVFTKAAVTWSLLYTCSLTLKTSFNKTYNLFDAQNLWCKYATVKTTTVVDMGRLLYIFGRCGNWLDAIGFVYSVK